MINSTHISLSGLQAAAAHVANSAKNLANIHSTQTHVNGETINTPYTATTITQETLETGGVKTTSRPKYPEPLVEIEQDTADNDTNTTPLKYPEVDIVDEITTQMRAKQAYKTNLTALKTQDDMLATFLKLTI